MTAVLLHSHGLSGRQWRKLEAELTARGERVLALDLVGQGQLEPWPESKPFSFTIDVERAAEIVRAEQPVHLVGHSYGGLIALHVARAEPVRTLSLFDPVAFSIFDDRDADARAILDASRLMPSLSHEDWLRAFVEFWGGRGAWDALREEARAEFRRTAWVIRQGVHSLAADGTPLSAFAGITCPTLLMTGEHSPLPARRVVERLAHALPNAREVVIAGAGHLAPVTHAREVNEHILSELARADRSDSPRTR